uniref:Protein CNPPD1 n=1 Tax=Syphacia muris TaxID=451379 RepID=A0A0N5ASC5_9BILA
MTLDFFSNGCVDPCTFLVAMVYIDRVRLADKNYFESSDPNDIYLSALVIASKFLYDGGLEEFVYNDEWAASASTSLDRVNELELKILDSWNINVDEKEFEDVLREAEYWVARNALKRGFFTYNEASILSSKMCLIDEVLVPLIAVLTSLFIAYSVVVLILPFVYCVCYEISYFSFLFLKLYF